jgi:hypothetical protein
MPSARISHASEISSLMQSFRVISPLMNAKSWTAVLMRDPSRMGREQSVHKADFISHEEPEAKT